MNLQNGYNGNLTSREAGSIGGQIVKKMIEAYEQGCSNAKTDSFSAVRSFFIAVFLISPIIYGTIRGSLECAVWCVGNQKRHRPLPPPAGAPSPKGKALVRCSPLLTPNSQLLTPNS